MTALILPDAVPDMTRSVTQRIRQIMPDAEFTDQTIAFPQIVVCLRHEPVRHMDRMFVRDQLRQHFFDVLVISHTVIGIRQSILICGQRCCVFPLGKRVLHIDLPQFHSEFGYPFTSNAIFPRLASS